MLGTNAHSSWGGKGLLSHSHDRRGWWITVGLAFPLDNEDTGHFSLHVLPNFYIFLSRNHFHHFPVKQGKDKSTKRSSASSLQFWTILQRVQDFMLIISTSRGRVSSVSQAIMYSSVLPPKSRSYSLPYFNCNC